MQKTKVPQPLSVSFARRKLTPDFLGLSIGGTVEIQDAKGVFISTEILPGKDSPKVKGVVASPITNKFFLDGLLLSITPALEAVRGVSISLFLSFTKKIHGLSISNFNITEDLKGVSLGFTNIIYGTGNVAKTKGVVVGLANICKHLKGIAVGFYNTTGLTNGLSIGIVNQQEIRSRGVQIGLINFVGKKAYPGITVNGEGLFSYLSRRKYSMTGKYAPDDELRNENREQMISSLGNDATLEDMRRFARTLDCQVYELALAKLEMPDVNAKRLALVASDPEVYGRESRYALDALVSAGSGYAQKYLNILEKR